MPGAITVKLISDASGFSAGIGQAESKMEKFTKNLNRAALGIAAGLVAAAPAMVDLSRKITELDAKSKVVFQDALPGVQKWAEANKTALGLTGRETVALATNMADLLKPMGFTSAEAANQSTKMLDLAGALSSWSGGQKSAAEVSDLLTDALLGETDGLKGLGISISASDVQARLAAQGQDKLTGAALQQATALATQALIMEKSTDAQTQWKNGSQAAAESQNKMKVSLNEAKEALAVALTPAIAAGTRALAAMADWANKNQGAVKILVGVVAGLGAAILITAAAIKVYNFALAVGRGAVTAFWIANKILNAVMRANPIGLVITALILLGGALVMLWKKSETFRNIVKGVWDKVKSAMITAVQLMGGAYLTFADGILSVFEKLLRAASKLPKWLGGGKFDDAANAVAGIRSGIQTMQTKLDNLGKPKLLKVDADVSAAEAKLDRLQQKMAALSRKSSGPAIATGSRGGGGGITAMAAGGSVRSGRPYLIGERGPELMVPGRSGTIVPNDQLGGGGIVVHNHIEIGGEVVRVVETRIAAGNRAIRNAVRAGSARSLAY